MTPVAVPRVRVLVPILMNPPPTRGALIRQPDGWFRYSRPERVVTVMRPDEVPVALREVEQRVERDRLTAVGFLSYEAAPGFDTALRVRDDREFPLLQFNLFRRGEPQSGPLPGRPEPVSWKGELDRSGYAERFRRVQAALRCGRSYQVNLSQRLRCDDIGDPWPWFRLMVDRQPTPYSAFLDTGRWVVACASPELFFSRSAQMVCCRPMKGTASRAADPDRDAEQAQQLRGALKERAENLMIVDMIRNDLGRIALPGTVAVPSLFDLEGYPSVWQMTSRVQARTDRPSHELFGALFPCASITGAPKVETMALIADLEVSPRRIYTGAVGFLAPGQQARFAVAIRTLLYDRHTGHAEYGVGSGVVWDSDSAQEWRECHLKALPVTAAASSPFELLETLRWSPQEGFWLLVRHLERLASAAAAVGYRFDSDRVGGVLDAAVAGHSEPLRVRLLLAEDGTARAECHVLADAAPEPVRLRWANRPVDSGNPLLALKTTRRDLYESALAGTPDCDDVILFNERGEVTETTIANLVCEIAGRWLTPASRCGLLPGTLRGKLLEEGVIAEAVISRQMLHSATTVWCVNSVRGWREARLLDRAPEETGRSVLPTDATAWR